MARRGVRVTDAQWAKIEPHLPRLPRTRRGGRPWVGHRAVIDGILWVLKTGARWRDLPNEYPSPRHVLAPVAALGRGRHVGTHLARVPHGTRRPRSPRVGDRVHRWHLCPGKKRGSDIGPTKRGKGTKCMVLVERQGLPLGICLASASPAEVRLVDQTLAARVTPHRRKPHRLVGDRGYDSDRLRAAMAARGIAFIAPLRAYRTNRACGRSATAAHLSGALGRRTHDRLVRRLSSLVDSSRTAHPNVSRVLSIRRRTDRAAEVIESSVFLLMRCLRRSSPDPQSLPKSAATWPARPSEAAEGFEVARAISGTG